MPLLSAPLRVFFLLLGILGSTGVGARVVLNALPEATSQLAEVKPEKAPREKRSNRPWATVWVDHRDNRYRVGENVIFYIKARRDVYITLLDVGTSGRVHVIFPNAYQKDNFVRAGQIVRIPGPHADFAIRAKGPQGRELIKLIAAESPHALLDALGGHQEGPYQQLASTPGEVADALLKALRAAHHGRWSEYAKVIEIID